MNHRVKLDIPAFNRGIDDILTLRPVRHALGEAVKAVSRRAFGSKIKPKKQGNTTIARGPQKSSRQK